MLRLLRDAGGGPALGVRVLAILLIAGLVLAGAATIVVPVLGWLLGSLG